MEIIRFHPAITGPRKGNPIITECIIKEGKKIVSGLALCSPRNKFSEYIGTDYARRRAKRKLKGRKVLPVNRIEAKRIMAEAGLAGNHSKVRILGPQMLKKVCAIEKKAPLTI